LFGGEAMKGTYQSDLKVLVKTELKLAETADSLCRRLNRIEEIGEEDRSELYSILAALKHEAQDDIAALQMLLAATGREAANV
jgi:hypothetical protein